MHLGDLHLISLAELLMTVAVCITIQAFFAASEAAIVVLDEHRMRAEGARDSASAAPVTRLLARRDRVLALTLTGANLATVVAASLSTTFLHQFGMRAALAAPFILAPFTLILGETIPKLVAFRRPMRVARIAAAPLRALSSALWPLLEAETGLSRAMRRMLGVPAELQSLFLTREDLAVLIRSLPDQLQHPARDAILPIERQMISRIFRFAGAEARKAMVPLVRVQAVALDSTVGEAIEVVRREGFSRLPVFRERIVDIVGVIHVFDLLEAPALDRPVSDLMRPVSYFAESTPLDEILLALQRTGQNMAVIVDEYGGAAGIVTLEDLLEEIVGEIEEEHRAGEDLVRVLNKRALRVMARTPITELNDRWGLKLPEADEYATIGGLVLEELGHIPRPGERIKLGGVTIIVARGDARAARELLVIIGRPHPGFSTRQ